MPCLKVDEYNLEYYLCIKNVNHLITWGW